MSDSDITVPSHSCLYKVLMEIAAASKHQPFSPTAMPISFMDNINTSYPVPSCPSSSIHRTLTTCHHAPPFPRRRAMVSTWSHAPTYIAAVKTPTSTTSTLLRDPWHHCSHWASILWTWPHSLILSLLALSHPYLVSLHFSASIHYCSSCKMFYYLFVYFYIYIYIYSG